MGGWEAAASQAFRRYTFMPSSKKTTQSAAVIPLRSPARPPPGCDQECALEVDLCQVHARCVTHWCWLRPGPRVEVRHGCASSALLASDCRSLMCDAPGQLRESPPAPHPKPCCARMTLSVTGSALVAVQARRCRAMTAVASSSAVLSAAAARCALATGRCCCVAPSTRVIISCSRCQARKRNFNGRKG